ncbi:MAG TPA: FAD-dependent oxidoreductase [Pseudobacteroides sp.]|uniref:NAD(P)/FAD-dependent oxidoreductase n=1 Tax=Pseudobacteroides sp. TaxID=1968840 RepID=UPI002F94D12E
MKYLIIGNGAAGIAAAEKIRKLDENGDISIISSEKYAVYSKCLLPDFLSGELSEERLYIRNIDFYEKNSINIHYSQKVTDIDFKLKKVMTENTDDNIKSCSIYEYDKLLIATGSTQLLPPIEGISQSNTYFLSTLDDTKRIIEDSKDARKIIIIGAGFVGLEAAFNLYKKGKEVTVIERAPRVLPGQLDEIASGMIQNGLEEEGIRLVLNASISKVTSSIYSNIVKMFTGVNTKSVILDDGRRFKADMIIAAAGSRPNLGFMKAQKLAVGRGITVDKYMQTSIKDVYAAGDVVESIDAVTEAKSLSPIWPNAVIQGETAGSNMAGVAREFSSLISMQNASEFREIPMISMGITAPDGPEYEEYLDYRPIDVVYRKLVIRDDTIVGMIFLGDIKNSGVIGALMKQKINVGKLKSNLLNPNFGYSEVGFLS